MSQTLAHNILSSSRTDDIQICEDVHFSSMLLKKPVLEGLLQNGFIKPSPIQFKAIPIGRFGYGKYVFPYLVNKKRMVF